MPVVNHTLPVPAFLENTARFIAGPVTIGVEYRVLDEAMILDPLVIDKAIDPFRAGSRNLATTAGHYGLEIPETGLHAAEADAVLAGRLMLALWRCPEVSGFSAGHLHERQVTHARRQAGSFRDYLHSETRHQEALAVRETWPYHPIGA